MNDINHDTNGIHTLALSPVLLTETEPRPHLMLSAGQPKFSLVQTQTQAPDYRHWCPQSQTIASADVLLGHLRSGWQLDHRVLVEVHQFGRDRRTELFYFTLTAGSDRICMPVLSNPVVLRLVEAHGLETVRVQTAPEDKPV